MLAYLVRFFCSRDLEITLIGSLLHAKRISRLQCENFRLLKNRAYLVDEIAQSGECMLLFANHDSDEAQCITHFPTAVSR